mmetsp:Transcript_32962/g.75940  ORF Transcript_32962/g.75940 Transcript_32962/m.75940 type:complete len:330 (+) Transcript_32962:149-1138(+)
MVQVPSDGMASSSSGSHPYYGYGLPIQARSGSSLESYGSPPSVAMHHPYVVGPPPYVTYSYGTVPPVHPGSYFAPWSAPPPPPQPVEYIRETKETDVLCGRGGATNSHSGNKDFRYLVKRHQKQYLRAKKKDKPLVASSIVDSIRKRGGRFLRRCDTTIEGDIVWVDIGDDRAREKTCQALREGAPERRRQRAPSYDEEDNSRHDREPGSSSETILSQRGAPPANEETPVMTKAEREDPSHTIDRDEGLSDDGPLVIRPCVRLMRRPVKEITVESLPPREQDLYTRTFLPPHPRFQKSLRKQTKLLTVQTTLPTMDARDDVESRRVEEV